MMTYYCTRIDDLCGISLESGSVLCHNGVQVPR